MCGIAGIVNFNGREILPKSRRSSFVDPLKLRGPDDKGDWHHSSGTVEVSFFHTRLSIIDLSGSGHQPMSISNDEIVVVFNGEIYNYKELLKELKEASINFQSSSDTEVLLWGFKVWGMEKLLSKVDGMFAFVLFEKKSEKAWLARDRFGKKPLYYCNIDSSIIFSSDIRSFYQIPSLSLTINHHSLGYFFSELSTPRAESIWNEIKKIPEGSYATFSAQEFKMHTFWELDFSNSNQLTKLETVDKTHELLLKAARKRLIADVPVAALLSGGIDSSLVVAMMAASSTSPIKTYTVTFDQPGLDERRYAKLVSERFNTFHTEIHLSKLDESVTDFVINEFGEPFADTSMLPTYVICREISKSEKVVCGGDGGDELFGGYYINYFASKLEKVRWLRRFSGIATLLAKIIPSYRTLFLKDLLQAAKAPDYVLLHRKMGFDPKEMGALFDNPLMTNSACYEHEKVWAQFSKPNIHLENNLIASFLHTRLVNDYLVKVDRASMMASLEMRSPFLDKDLAQFAATFKPANLYDDYGTKPILKALAEKFFPKEFVHRNKMGFGVPLEQWLRNEWSEKFKDEVFSKQTLIEINYCEVEKIFNLHQNGHNYTEQLWCLYVFHIWANNYKSLRK